MRSSRSQHLAIELVPCAAFHCTQQWSENFPVPSNVQPSSTNQLNQRLCWVVFPTLGESDCTWLNTSCHDVPTQNDSFFLLFRSRKLTGERNLYHFYSVTHPIRLMILLVFNHQILTQKVLLVLQLDLVN